MTDNNETEPRTFALDAGKFNTQYGSHLDHAPTKEEHDKRVALTGRNYTDDGRQRHGHKHTNTDTVAAKATGTRS